MYYITRADHPFDTMVWEERPDGSYRQTGEANYDVWITRDEWFAFVAQDPELSSLEPGGEPYAAVYRPDWAGGEGIALFEWEDGYISVELLHGRGEGKMFRITRKLDAQIIEPSKHVRYSPKLSPELFDEYEEEDWD